MAYWLCNATVSEGEYSADHNNQHLKIDYRRSHERVKPLLVPALVAPFKVFIFGGRGQGEILSATILHLQMRIN